MAADDDKNESSDPWADLVADDLGAEGDEVSFSFVEKTPPEFPGDGPSADEAASESTPGVEPEIDVGGEIDLASELEADALSAELTPSSAADEVAAAEDDEVEAWLSASDDETATGAGNELAAEHPEPAPPLSVFAPDEPATGDEPATEHASQSSIEIGTGFSGIDMAAEGEGSDAVTAAEGLDAKAKSAVAATCRNRFLG